MAGARGTLPWRYRLSLRLRITLVTAAVVAVVVALGGLLILVALESELVDSADEAARARAAEVAVDLASGRLDTPLPTMRDPESFAEVIADGSLVTATQGLDARNKFKLPEMEAGDVAVEEVSRLPFEEPGPFRVVSRGVDTPSGPMTVHVAVPIGDLERTMSTAARTGAIGLSVLVLVLASVLWLAIGRTLAPVNAIRIRADAITPQHLDRRVPVPPHHDEVGRLARTVNQMLARLQQSVETQQRFVADAAHELRSPITSLRVQLETAGGMSDPSRADMLQETARMETLVDQLLLLARADSDVPWVRTAPVDLDDLIDSAVRSSDTRAGVVVDTSAVEPVQLAGDAALLERVVRNLVENAVGHADAQVRVAASRVGGGVALLTVDDDGSGVPEDRRQAVFDRFVRLDDSRSRRRGGVGLGLAIVAEIVRAHGGRVEVTDSPLGGARFAVELPVDHVTS